MPPVDFDTLDPRFRWMRDYLAKLAPPGLLPGRQHIDPQDLRGLLPFVNLVDVERAGGALHFRYRLIGTMQVGTAGSDATGQYVDAAALPSLAGRIRANLEAVASHRQPLHDVFPLPQPGREFISTERVYFPLARDGTTVDMILCLYAYPGDETLNAATLPPARGER